MNISEPFIRRPIATSLLMAAIVFVGVFTYPLLPVAPLPQVDFPTIQVSASLPGASSDTMASVVAAPLERQFGQISGVTQMISTSTLGMTSITLQFELTRSIDAAAQDVQAAITAAGKQLPTTLSAPPTYRKTIPANSPIMILAAHSDTLPITKVDDFADNVLAQRISQVPGVALVTIGGEQKPAVRVQIDPGKLAATGMTLEDVRGVLVNATTDAAKGNLNGAQKSFTIAANDQLTAAAGYDDVILAYRNGAPIRVRDIGKAVDAAENVNIAAWENDKPAVVLVVFKQPGANVIDTVDQIKEAMPQLQRRHSGGYEGRHHRRSDADHPCLGEGRAVHAHAHHRAGRDGDLHVPAQCRRHRYTQHYGAPVAAWRHRDHVPPGIQPRQSLADGADHRGRLRGR